MSRGRSLAVCAAFVAVLLTPIAVGAQEPSALEIDTVDTSGHPAMQLSVSVPAHPDGPLPAEAFTVRENGEERAAEVEYTASTGLQILLLVDTTGSMGGRPITGARDAATRFIGDLPDATEVAVMGFAVEPAMITDFTATKDEHLAGIEALQAEGETAMYDAVASAVDAFPEAEEETRRVIVLLADGEDNASEASLVDATAALTDAEVTLHSVEYLTSATEGAAIRSMANATGGSVLQAGNTDELVAVYEQLAADLVSRYLLTYPSEAEGSTELVVEVAHEDLAAMGSRVVELPALPAEPEQEPETTAAPPVITAPPSRFGQAALVIGALLWFAALSMLVTAFVVPRERRAQLWGASKRHTGTPKGVSELAHRASMIADRGLERRGYSNGLNQALERAGIDLRPGEFVVLVASAAVTAGAVGLLHSGIMGVLLALLCPIGARLLVSFKAGRRQARFADQLSEVLQLLSGSLRAGYSLMQAVDSVAREADSPSAEEFGRLIVETRLGRDMNDALHAMADRMQSEDFSWVMQAIEIHREVGGDLAEVLDTVGGTIRERNQIRRQVKALSAEGRLSAYVLLALPFGVGFIIFLTNPAYMAELTQGGLLGWGLLGIGAMLMTVGVVWMRKLVKLEF